ncbi:MAG: hypothetical protein J0M08_04170 [Bacteroidetes bacterium]|nr:hypothetical protein [Bacteroidota bacterium]
MACKQPVGNTNPLKETYQEAPIKKIKWPNIKKSWHLLTITDTASFIYIPCDAGTPTLEFTIKEDSIFLYRFYGQDDQTYYITDLTDFGNDSYKFACTCLSEKSYTDTLHLTIIENIGWWSFDRWSLNERMWDKKQYPYISNEQIKNYKIINQPCTDCWEDFMCDSSLKK